MYFITKMFILTKNFDILYRHSHLKLILSYLIDNISSLRGKSGEKILDILNDVFNFFAILNLGVYM